MRLHFVDNYPLLGTADIEGQEVHFAWVWRQPCLRVTFADLEPSLIGRVIHLDDLPRLAAAPDNLAWLHHDDPARSLAVLDFATDLWRRKEAVFRTCDG
ncbi:hypothetical protein [Glycomyces xiaoerkulensis]|uniref:hypothetical protein n=1 Tax=Glycomyces xiaoerkulensis TaxID=2038139 RepID=UPI000C25CF2C|nr:hypothetical protein [Glycomyces xiaoerkulensis]